MKINRKAIETCYEIVLGREADEVGLEHFLQLAEKNTIISAHDIARIMIASAEFKKKYQSHDVFANMAPVSFRGIDFILPVGDFTYKTLKKFGDYEPYVLDVLIPRLKPGMTFLDVGANLGLFALPAARVVGPHGRVIAFEASSQNANIMMMGARQNKLDNIDVIPLGASDENGVALTRRMPHTSLNLFVDEQKEDFTDKHELFPMVTIDSFLTYRCPKVDIFKVDVDGYEYKVLLGAKQLISRDMPDIFMEYSDHHSRKIAGVPGEELLRLVLDFGYVATILHREREPEIVEGSSQSEVIKRIITVQSEFFEATKGGHIDLLLEAKAR